MIIISIKIKLRRETNKVTNVVKEQEKYFFSYIFQTIQAYLSLVVGRPQWKKTTNPQTLRKFKGFWGVQHFKKTTVWVFDPDPDVGRAPTDCASIVALQPFFIAYP